MRLPTHRHVPSWPVHPAWSLRWHIGSSTVALKSRRILSADPTALPSSQQSFAMEIVSLLDIICFSKQQAVELYGFLFRHYEENKMYW